MKEKVYKKNNLAPVFNVVHSSYVDGWGIRTTIFLKGCPLRCLWCCNPEGQNPKPEIKFIKEKCNGCGKCIPSCDKGALSIDNLESGSKILSIDRTVCNGCGKCLKDCWYGALGIFGVFRSPEEMMEEILPDKAFYDSTGGGLTIGGGEATLYPEFCIELIERCHKEGINVGIDSCGVCNENGRKVYDKADFVLFDIKGMDREAHIRNTGLGNEVILGNLKYLDSIDKPVIIRIPLIPEHNDNDMEIEKIGAMLETMSSIKRVDVIPFHEFGKIKYAQIGKSYIIEAPPVSQERQEQVVKMLESHGLKVQIGG